MGFGRNSNSFKLLWLSLLPAKNDEDPMEELECSQDFSHYNPMGAICCHGNQSSDPIWPKSVNGRKDGRADAPMDASLTSIL